MESPTLPAPVQTGIVSTVPDPVIPEVIPVRAEPSPKKALAVIDEFTVTEAL
jgi:hypothetical protein